MRINPMLMYDAALMAFVGKEQKSFSFEEERWRYFRRTMSGDKTKAPLSFPLYS